MSKNKKLKSGFTLLELVIALGIFMIFIGAIMNSFISLTSTQQKANLSREAASEAKDLLNYISVEAREKRIDYSCKTANNSTYERDEYYALNCSDVNLETDIVFITNDGLERIIVSSSKDNTSEFITITTKKQTRNNLISNWETVSDTPLHSERLKILSSQFNITPTQDPYNFSIEQDITNLQQPKVEIILNIERNSKTQNASQSTNLPIILQTSISSRSYSPQEI